MIALPVDLESRGIFSPLDEHFARALARIAGETNPAVLLAAALVSRYVRNGHVCLDLRRLTRAPALVDENGCSVGPEAWPELPAWLAALRGSPLVSDGSTRTPLVLDGEGRVYLRRYWEHQQRVADAIRARTTELDDVAGEEELKQSLARLFPSDCAAEVPDRQRVAAVLAHLCRFCVISGGPGTGKTSVVVKILASLVERARREGRDPLRILLLAPTGKAAARLSEAIRGAKERLACGEEVRSAIPEQARTIHRGLGSIRNRSACFRHNAENPLVVDVVLVDEASMVDLALMARLVAAMPPAARLILLGDKDQLASVEAGAVLGDICDSGGSGRYSRGLVRRLVALTGDRLPFDGKPPGDTGIWDCIVELEHSYRYDARSGIGRLARAVNEGDIEAVLALLESGYHSDVVLAESPSGVPAGRALQEAVLEGFGAFLREEDPAAKLDALTRFRVICAHRRGSGGVEDLNRRTERVLHERGFVRLEGEFYPGRVIMVTRNDAQIGLFNGDVGVIATIDSRTGRKAAFFPAAPGSVSQNGPGGYRAVSLACLPPHETAFALTVHKSQGSEFEEVAVVLPSAVSPVLSRELLYTAVTRARRKVTIYGSREVVAQAVTRRVERASGLRNLLWNPGVA